VETVDWTGGQIHDNDDASDIRDVDLTQVHYLSGPIACNNATGEPAHPGDLLCVEICNLGPLPGDEWGFTGASGSGGAGSGRVERAREARHAGRGADMSSSCCALHVRGAGTFDRDNGGGFLTDHFPCATKAIWHFDGIYASSRHIPGVRFPGLIHPGLIGTAPSAELLATWNARERALVEGPLPTLATVLHTRPLALLPEPKGAFLGSVAAGTPEFERIAAEGARTVPGRENGGNCDIKNLSRGCRVYLPVFVEGANLSMGDMHFSQGDGEVSFCGAIEMSGWLELKVDILRGGMAKYLSPMGPTPLHVHPIFEIGPVEPRFSEWLVFEGISVDERGVQHYLDASIAYKRAVLNCIDYLAKHGFTREQAYLLLSCCPCEGRLSGVVDVPNAVATLALPLAIFDIDIRPQRDPAPGAPPSQTGPRLLRAPRGDVCKCAYTGGKPVFQNPCLPPA
jgi:formamidase